MTALDGMQIVIPMSGFGERFRSAGYDVPKPMIQVDDKTIIEHVIALFPGETDFTFICNQEHLDTLEFGMADLLMNACPKGRIIGIAPHKLGPIHAVQQVIESLDSERPVLVNYCDFSQLWDWEAFKSFVVDTNCDGSIPSYRGFHPHSLGSTFYAYLKLDVDEKWMVDIQEKQSWTARPIDEYASSGSYYFRSVSIMARYFAKCIEQGLDVNGEYYVSMAYRPMAYDGLKVNAYPVEFFMQWGTPGDLQEYQAWDRLFRRYRSGKPPDNHSTVAGSVVIPMAGLGSRFAKAGYTTPKPLIRVGSQTMIERAINDMPKGEKLIVVTRSDLPGNLDMADVLKDNFDSVEIVSMESVSEGQAISCLCGVERLDDTMLSRPLTIAACDNGVVFDTEKLITDMEDFDCLVWGYRGHAAAIRNPTSYSWIVVSEDGLVEKVEVKQLSGDAVSTPIVIGAFTFRTADLYKQVTESLVERNERVNGEFYADSIPNILVEMGYRVKLFEVDHFVSFGTPDELRTYKYWYDCFLKWSLHPLGKDIDA